MLKFVLSVIALDTLVPLVYGLMVYNRLGRDLRALVYYLAISLVYTIAMIILLFTGYRNLWISNVWDVVPEFFFLYILSLWEENARRAQIIRWLFLPFILSWIYELLKYGVTDFSQIQRAVGLVFIIGVSAYILFRHNNRYEMTLLSQPAFWICSGWLIQSSGLLTLALMSHLLFHIYPIGVLRAAHAFIKPTFSLIEVGFYLLGLICQTRQHQLQRFPLSSFG